MDLSCSRPVGDPTTVIDVCDRDEQDDFLFPLTTNISWFTRNSERRVLPFSPVVQEFAFRGEAKFGSVFQFEIGNVRTCDLLTGIMLQVKLNHWLPNYILENLKTGAYVYKDLSDAWFYANSMGTILVKEASLNLEDHTIEKVNGTFTNIFSALYPDLNTQFGISTDAYGYVSIPDLVKWNPKRAYPTEKGWISCLLPFSFLRERLRSTFPLVAVKDGTVRVNLSLRPFSECVRKYDGKRVYCDDTPLGKTFTFLDTRVNPPKEVTYKVSNAVPEFDSVRLVTYGLVVDGLYRKAMMHTPFDRLFRTLQSFQFDEPTKYTKIPDKDNTLKVVLPLECNGPVEEILWVLRRKAVRNNNEWTNFSAVLETEYDPVYTPFVPLLVDAAIQIDGENIVEGSEMFFRHHIGKVHKGGIVPYKGFIYGYSFAKNPGTHDPSGWFNASRTNDVRIRFTIKPPGGLLDLDWEIFVYVVGLNWIKFQEGIASLVYSS